MSLNIVLLKLLPYLPGANELKKVPDVLPYIAISSHAMVLTWVDNIRDISLSL